MNIIKKYREIIAYVLFGALTTLVSMAVYFAVLWIGETAFEIDSDSDNFYAVRVIGQILQWVCGVLVAFFTNKKYVFLSKSKNKKQTLTELLKFSSGRVFTLLIDSLLTFGTVALLKFVNYKSFVFVITFTPDVWSKIVSGIVVIISNYLLGKFFVFRRSKH